MLKKKKNSIKNSRMNLKNVICIFDKNVKNVQINKKNEYMTERAKRPVNE